MNIYTIEPAHNGFILTVSTISNSLGGGTQGLGNTINVKYAFTTNLDLLQWLKDNLK
jgi:hypothetical protein